MAKRLVQVFLPSGDQEELDGILRDYQVLGRWQHDDGSGREVIQVLCSAEKCEPLLDQFQLRYRHVPGFGCLMLAVEAVIPREEEAGKSEPGAPEGAGAPKGPPPLARVSREELTSKIGEGIVLSRTFFAMTFLSAIVAAVGLLRDDLAVIIGAMVIAPLLSPNVALALSVTLGDVVLLRRALWTNLAGVSVALALSVLIGALFGGGEPSPMLMARTRVGASDVVLSLASGAAGCFAFTSGAPAALIGVMVAVALMPPLVSCGIFLGAGRLELAAAAFLLLAANVICLNLAGVATFIFQGVRPRTWWEAEKASRATRTAFALWGVLFLLLVAVVLLR